MLRYNTEKEFLEGYLGDIQRNQNLGEEEYQILKKIISCEVFERIFGQTSIDEERIELKEKMKQIFYHTRLHKELQTLILEE